MGEMTDEINAFYAVKKRTIWNRLGFGIRPAPRPNDMEEEPGFAASWFMVCTHAHLDWKDRMRTLVSGRIYVEHAIKTDVPINRSRAVSAVSVLPPGDRS